MSLKFIESTPSKAFPTFFRGLQSLAVTGCLLVACPMAATAADAEVATPVVDVSGAENIKGLKRVALTQFEVQFVSKHIGAASFSGSFGFGKASQTTELKTVQPEQMQAIVDTYYDQAVTELSLAGIEVVGLPQLEANADYQNLKAKGYPAPFRQMPLNRDGLSIDGTFYTAHGLPIYFMKDRAETEGRGSGRVSYLEVGTLMSNGFKVSYVEAYEKAIAKAFDAHILRVRMTVPFAEMTASGGLFRTSASVSTKTGLRLDSIASRYELLEGGSRIARIGLKADFPLPTPLGKLDDSERDRPYFVVDGAEYAGVIGAHLMQAHKAFQATIVAKR